MPTSRTSIAEGERDESADALDNAKAELRRDHRLLAEGPELPGTPAVPPPRTNSRYLQILRRVSAPDRLRYRGRA